MQRRTFLGTVAAGAGGLAAPRLGRGAAVSTLKFVPVQNLVLLNPIATELHDHAQLPSVRHAVPPGREL